MEDWEIKWLDDALGGYTPIERRLIYIMLREYIREITFIGTTDRRYAELTQILQATKTIHRMTDEHLEGSLANRLVKAKKKLAEAEAELERLRSSLL